MNQDQDHSIKGIQIVVTDSNYADLFEKRFCLLWKTDNFYSIGHTEEDVMAIAYLSRSQFNIVT